MESKDREIDETENLETLEPDELVDDHGDRAVPYVVVLAGESVGRVIKLEKCRIMKAGRVRSCEMYFDCDNISREHATFLTDAEGKTTLSDLGSTNGTIVNGKKIKTAVLSDGDRICLGNVILRFSFKDGLEFDFQQSLYQKATRDPLTGAYNKRYFMEYYQREFAFHLRKNQPLSLLILDLDDFKKLNDSFGHVNGDIVLKGIGRKVMADMRKEDTFARFGGEEFVAMFRDTNAEMAATIAAKIHQIIGDMVFQTKSRTFQVTATVGVVTLLNGNYETPDEMLMAADQKLYLGKSQGKNRVVD